MQGTPAHRLFEYLIEEPNLIAILPLNEPFDGTVYDRSQNFLSGTPSGTPGFGYPVNTLSNAGQFTSGNSEYLSTTGSALVTVGDIDWCGEAWINPTSYPGVGSFLGIVTKWNGGQSEYAVLLDSSGYVRLQVRDTGDTATMYAITFSAAPLNTWTRIKWFHDAANDILAIGINEEIFSSIGYSAGIRVGTAAFEIGRYNGGSYFNGRIAPVGLWKRLLTSTEWTALNPGIAWSLNYLQLTSVLKYGLQVWYDMTEASGSRLDSTANALNLVDNNTVTAASGVIRIDPHDFLGMRFTRLTPNSVNFGNELKLGFDLRSPFSAVSILLPRQGALGKHTILNKGVSGGARYIWYNNHSALATRTHSFELNDGANAKTWTGAALSEGVAYCVGFSYDGSVSVGGVQLYTNGLADAMSNSGTMPSLTLYNTGDFLVGNSELDEGFDGEIGLTAIFAEAKGAELFRRAAAIARLF